MTDPVVDQFWLDSRLHVSTSPAAGSVTLAAGQKYRLEVDGNWTAWSNSILLGMHIPVKYVSPGGGAARDSASDAIWTYADRDVNRPPSLSAGGIFIVSADNGATWIHLSSFPGYEQNPASGPRADQTYSFALTGGGYPLRVAIQDSPISDNNGLMKFTLYPAGGWVVGAVAAD